MYGDNYLAHYGILGMKWGRRRTPTQLGHTPGGPDKAKTEPAKPKPKSLSEMSDAELRARLDRINMERQYKQYLAEMNPKKESMIKRVALKILENGMTTIGNKVVGNIADNLFKKTETDKPLDLSKRDVSKLGPKEAAAMATYAKNLKKIEAYMNGDPIKDD